MTVRDRVECGSCGATYECERRKYPDGTPMANLPGDILCGVCGCRDERMVRIDSRQIRRWQQERARG